MLNIENPMILNIESKEYMKELAICEECGDSIYEDDIYFNVDDTILCDNCIDSYIHREKLKIAHKSDFMD